MLIRFTETYIENHFSLVLLHFCNFADAGNHFGVHVLATASGLVLCLVFIFGHFAHHIHTSFNLASLSHSYWNRSDSFLILSCLSFCNFRFWVYLEIDKEFWDSAIKGSTLSFLVQETPRG
jgi:hypothetical protein